jgi:YD repeat-containing protein
VISGAAFRSRSERETWIGKIMRKRTTTPSWVSIPFLFLATLLVPFSLSQTAPTDVQKPEHPPLNQFHDNPAKRITEYSLPMDQLPKAYGLYLTNGVLFFVVQFYRFGTVTDEAGNSRQSCAHGLGRMTSVFEDPGSSPHLHYQTTYQYDVLGDLTNVTQNGSNSAYARIRTFAYDSLAHLTSAANPESGTITYAYDADGNVITKTAPLPNQTGSTTVTTTNTYDKLNRVIKKSYTDSYTPLVQFGYDGVALGGCTIAPPGDTDTYPVGRKTSMCDGSGAASWAHDKMGRVLSERRTIGAVAGDYETDAYNLNGSPITVTTLGYGVTYTYSTAARPLTATNYTGGTTKFVSGAIYAPPGELAGATLGSATGFAGFTVNNSYNDRLQPALLSASSPSATVFSDSF